MAWRSSRPRYNCGDSPTHRFPATPADSYEDKWRYSSDESIMAVKMAKRRGALDSFLSLFSPRGKYDVLEPDPDQVEEVYDLGQHGDRELQETSSSTKARRKRAWACVGSSFFARLHAFAPKMIMFSDDLSGPLHPTAWLDGVRGVAAFLVVFHHTSLLWWSWAIHYGWGTKYPQDDGVEVRYFMQLPFIRFVISGAPQVMIFFVVSGFSLSYKPMKLVHQGRFAEVLEALASSVFRRHSRLFIPAAVVGFLGNVAMWAGFFHTASQYNAGSVAPNREVDVPPDFGGALRQWATDFWRMSDPLSWHMDRGFPYHYDANLWTLPIEFDCSLMVFAGLLALCRLRARPRVIIMVAVVAICHWNNQPNEALFLTGIYFADLHFLAGRQKPRRSATVEVEDHDVALEPCLPPSRPPSPVPVPASASASAPAPAAWATPKWLSRPAVPPWLSCALALAAFAVSLHLLAFPLNVHQASKTPGYRWLTDMTPSNYGGNGGAWWSPIGAMLLVATVDRAPFLQAVFTTRFAQYLGRISYSMYLIHGQLIWTLGLHLGRLSVEFFVPQDDHEYFLCVAMAFVPVLIILFVLSDLAATHVDARAVAVGKRVYGALVAAAAAAS